MEHPSSPTENYVLASDGASGWREIPYANVRPTMFNSWLTLGPEAIRSSCRRSEAHRRSSSPKTAAPWRRANRRWPNLQHRPHHVPAQLSDPVSAGDRRRRACQGLLLVEQRWTISSGTSGTPTVSVSSPSISRPRSERPSSAPPSSARLPEAGSEGVRLIRKSNGSRHSFGSH